MVNGCAKLCLLGGPQKQMVQNEMKPSGHIVNVGTGEVAYRAFVPSPLPPKLSLTTDPVSALSEADRALGELAGLGRCLPNPHLLVRPFMRREAVLS